MRLSKIVGVCEAALPAVEFGRLHMWNSLQIKNNTLKMRHFGNLNREFGELTIDLLATRTNRKCRRNYSYSPEPEAAGTDAFLCNWNMENFYAFPPFSLISRVLQKIENENAEGILIVPAFTTQPCFPILLRLLINPPVKLPNSRDSLYFAFRRKEQPQLPNMKLKVCLVSGDSMKTKVFQQRLQIFFVNSWRTGTQSRYGTYIRE